MANDRSEYMRAYRERNRARLTDLNWDWRQRNPEKVAAMRERQRVRRGGRRKPPPAYPEVPEAFGHWMAGFIDGEGSFVITRNNLPAGGYRVHFILGLRDDDAPILQECIDKTGVGHLYRQLGRPRGGGLCRSQATWMVCVKHDCQRLVEILDRFPLRAKKARDYAIWREAVAVHAEFHPGRPSKGELRWDWEPLAVLREQLIAARAYPEPTRG